MTNGRTHTVAATDSTAPVRARTLPVSPEALFKGVGRLREKTRPKAAGEASVELAIHVWHHCA